MLVVNSEQTYRREEDRSITTLTMAVERLAESQTTMSLAQGQMATEIKDLAKTISKLDIVMEKMVHIEERYNSAFASIGSRVQNLEKGQTEGCPALREVKVDYNGKYEKVIEALHYNKKNIENIQAIVSKVAWGVVSVVGLAIIGLVIK